jgi:uncharacterized protein (TIGR02001 family)
VDFGGDVPSGSYGTVEMNYVAGWAGTFGDSDIGIDVGYIYYDYPGDSGDEGDYQEVYVSGSWKDLAIGVHYSDDYYLESDEFWYVYGEYSLGLFDTGLTMDFHVGYNMLEEDGGFLSSDEDAYTDYSVALTYSWASVDWSVAYVGTDLDDDDLFGTDWGDDTVTFTISKSL